MSNRLSTILRPAGFARLGEGAKAARGAVAVAPNGAGSLLACATFRVAGVGR